MRSANMALVICLSMLGAAGYQIQRWEISYLPSASLLKFLRRNRPAGGANAGPLALCALANPYTDYNGDGRPEKAPLAGALQEVAVFSPSFPRKQVFSGKTALESHLRRMHRESDVLHLACHGEFYPHRPWNSTLFLARGSDRLFRSSACAPGVSVPGGAVPRGAAPDLTAPVVGALSIKLGGLRFVVRS